MSELNLNSYKSTLEYFESTNWQCPEKLTLQLYEISICDYQGLGRHSNTYKINEFFIPEYNIGINHQPFYGYPYNIISNANKRYERYENDAKLINSCVVTKISNQSQLEEIFDLIKTNTKAKNMHQTIKNLYTILETTKQNN